MDEITAFEHVRLAYAPVDEAAAFGWVAWSMRAQAAITLESQLRARIAELEAEVTDLKDELTDLEGVKAKLSRVYCLLEGIDP